MTLLNRGKSLRIDSGVDLDHYVPEIGDIVKVDSSLLR